MKKNFNLDGHKLAYHPDRVGKFLTTDDCYPLYMEISPAGSCNHRCVFCAYDYIGYPNRKLDYNRFMNFIKEASEAGVKSFLYAGEGEPLLHPNIGEFITHSKQNGIDVGMYTNGHLLKESLAQEIIPLMTFIRFSFNGGNAKTYANVHKTKESIFEKVVSNIENAVKIKKDTNSNISIGSQFVLLPENIDSLEDAVMCMKEVGADYISIKPFVQQSDEQFYKMERPFDLQELDERFKKLEEHSTDLFRVMARKNAFEKYGQRDYCNCLGTSFVSAMNSAGEIATCLPYWDNKDFVFGNINESSFKEIWEGEKRAKIKEFLETKLDVKKVCPPNCRPNAINSYLYELKNPSIEHINFI
jgi:radical SAM protein with 4Fe4S-binding SPASM domain